MKSLFLQVECFRIPQRFSLLGTYQQLSIERLLIRAIICEIAE